MKRVPASGSTLKNLMRTSIKDILYQWIISSRYRIIKNSIPQVIENVFLLIYLLIYLFTFFLSFFLIYLL